MHKIVIQTIGYPYVSFVFLVYHAILCVSICLINKNKTSFDGNESQILCWNDNAFVLGNLFAVAVVVFK